MGGGGALRDYNLKLKKVNGLFQATPLFSGKDLSSSGIRILHTGQQDCDGDHKMSGVMTSTEQQ